MRAYSKFDVESYSEEAYPFTEDEYNEVMQASAVDETEWQGYPEWSEALEQSAFESSLERRATVQTPHGAMLIKRECDHKDCRTDRCKQSVRIGGVEI
jgi:hypothetical protein